MFGASRRQCPLRGVVVSNDGIKSGANNADMPVDQYLVARTSATPRSPRRDPALSLTTSPCSRLAAGSAKRRLAVSALVMEPGVFVRGDHAASPKKVYHNLLLKRPELDRRGGSERKMCARTVIRRGTPTTPQPFVKGLTSRSPADASPDDVAMPHTFMWMITAPNLCRGAGTVS